MKESSAVYHELPNESSKFSRCSGRVFLTNRATKSIQNHGVTCREAEEILWGAGSLSSGEQYQPPSQI